MPSPGAGTPHPLDRNPPLRSRIMSTSSIRASAPHAPTPTDQDLRYPPGDLAIWIFILAELLVFATFFASYAFARLEQAALLDQYQASLNRDLALINTLALITSSYFVVQAVAAIRNGAART